MEHSVPSLCAFSLFLSASSRDPPGVTLLSVRVNGERANSKLGLSRSVRRLEVFETKIRASDWEKLITGSDGSGVSCAFAYLGRGAGGTFSFAGPMVLTVPRRLCTVPCSPRWPCCLFPESPRSRCVLPIDFYFTNFQKPRK